MFLGLTLSLKGNFSDKLSDGSYFIDADPEIFKHILRYLRTRAFPLFYSRADGFDYGLYAALLAQAKFFGIPRLADWIRNRKYQEAVRIRTSVNTSMSLMSNATVKGPSENDPASNGITYNHLHIKKRVYRCPSKTPVHTEPSHCGKRCANARVEGQPLYEDEECLCTIETHREVVFNHNICHEDENVQ